MPQPPLDSTRPMDGLTRRSFLRASGVVGAAAALAGLGKVGLDAVLARAATDPLPTGTPILLLVTLYGGNDGLNTLVPYADPAYHAARPGLAYQPDQVLRLDDRFGLNPGLTATAAEFAAGRLAIVRGVGYPRPDRSHFRSMDIWQTGSPSEPITSGWVGRWLDSAGGDPLLALTIGETLPPVLVGNRSSAGALTATDRAPSRVVENTLAALAAGDPADPPAAQWVRASYTAYGKVRALASAGESGTTTQARGEDLADQLAVVARCIRAGAPTRVYAVSLTGFDTHADELADQAALLTELDRGLAGFREAVAGHERGGDVVTLVYSEFGRRVAANGSDGTDHGTAGIVLLHGNRVAGGLHGEQPSLTDLVDGDLKVTTDFRSIYADVLTGVLQTEPARILPAGSPGGLGLVRSM